MPQTPTVVVLCAVLKGVGELVNVGLRYNDK